MAAAAGTTITVRAFRLDTNGLAADKGTDGTSTPTCSFADGVLRAETNYNSVTVELRLLAEEAALIAAAGDCEANIASMVDEFAATLRLEIAAPAIGDDKARRLTTDYPLSIAPMFASDAIAKFLAEIASGDRQWLGGDSDDWDGDEVLNPYDWTPTSVTVGGRVDVSVNLTLGLTGEGGTKDNPWPIYNIWQLQAIDGKSVSASGEIRDGLAFFGVDAAAALTLQYALAVDIDATPTKEWKNNAGNATVGFDPIGGDFTGYLDGNGFAVRGLFIDRSGDSNVGLFGRIVKAGEVAVWNLGVEDADIRGGNRSGALVGENDANLGKVWTTGRVRGGEGVGGVAGQLIGQRNTIMMSWSTADVDGEQLAGGFAGFNFPAETTDRVFYNDNWAGGNVNSGDGAAGGFVSNPFQSNFARNWSAGAVLGRSGGGFAGINTVPVSYASVYWNTDTSGQSDGGAGVVGVVVQTLTVSNFGDATAAAAWHFGDSDFTDSDPAAADFPLLADLSRPWQAVNLARALTRVLILEDGTMATADGRSIVRERFALDIAFGHERAGAGHEGERNIGSELQFRWRRVAGGNELQRRDGGVAVAGGRGGAGGGG